MTDPHPADAQQPRPSATSTDTGLYAEIITVLRANAQETMARHTIDLDGQCGFCASMWRHTDTPWPCAAVRIAHEFLALTDT